MAIHTQTKKTKKQKNKKNKKKQKKQKDKTQHSASDPLPLGCAILFFLFFLVFWFFGFLVSWFFGFLVCVWIAQTLPMGLNFFFCVLDVFGQTAKNHGKTKKTKSSDPCPLPGLSQTLPMGLNFFFVFSIVVLNVFHVKMLSSQYLSKKCASPHLLPPGQTAKKNHGKTKIH